MVASSAPMSGTEAFGRGMGAGGADQQSQNLEKILAERMSPAGDVASRIAWSGLVVFSRFAGGCICFGLVQGLHLAEPDFQFAANGAGVFPERGY